MNQVRFSRCCTLCSFSKIKERDENTQLCPQLSNHKLYEPPNYDVILEHETGCVRAEKQRLVSISPVFKGIFRKKSVRSKSPGEDVCARISVPKRFKLSSIHAIVRFSFGEELNMEEDIFDVREAARYYLITSLFQVIEDKVRVLMQNEDTFCFVFKHACLLKDLNLKLRCLQVFNSKLDQRKVLLSKHFLSLEFDIGLRQLLEMAKLTLEAEEVWELCCEWAISQESSQVLLQELRSLPLFRPMFSQQTRNLLSDIRRSLSRSQSQAVGKNELETDRK